MCGYPKAILKIGMQLHAMSLCTIWPFGPFCFHSANKQMLGRVLILFLLASAQYTPVLWKYRCPVQYFVEKH